MIIKSFSAALASICFVLTGCDTSEWPGPGSDNTQAPQPGGYTDTTGAHFGGWVNNAWGPESTIIPLHKDHPPLAGVNVCLLEDSSMPCAITDQAGRYDLEGLPADEDLHISVQLRDYYSLLIPINASTYQFDDHPAVEMPSFALEAQTYEQLTTERDLNKGGMNFFIVSGQLEADPEPDHAEINATLKGVGVRYRQVYTSDQGETFGPWSDPRGWTLSGGDVVYLNADESPDSAALHTSSSGLGLALNLSPGLYEIEADDTNDDQGLDYLLTPYHWQCEAMAGTPTAPGNPSLARARVVAAHLTDVRINCQAQ